LDRIRWSDSFTAADIGVVLGGFEIEGNQLNRPALEEIELTLFEYRIPQLFWFSQHLAHRKPACE
jgi:hypothetical protein